MLLDVKTGDRTFQEVRYFTPRFFEEIRNVRRKEGGTRGKTSFFLIPCAKDTWLRAKAFAGRAKSNVTLSRQWEVQQEDFSYTYSAEGFVCITGYWSHPFFVDSQRSWNILSFLSGRSNHRALQIQEAFRKRYAHEVLPWYPTLSYHVPPYDWYKALDIASATAECAARSRGPGEALDVLEIGAGGSILPLVLRKLLNIRRYTVIDLDTVIPFGFFVVSFAAPLVHLRLPGEADDDEAWLEFQSAGEIDIAPNSVDIAVNVTSFQEMNDSLVAQYFGLIERSLRRGGIFACVNRKNRQTNFQDYPWPQRGYETLVDEEDFISRYGHRDQVILRRIIRKVQ